MRDRKESEKGEHNKRERISPVFYRQRGVSFLPLLCSEEGADVADGLFLILLVKKDMPVPAVVIAPLVVRAPVGAALAPASIP